MSIIGDEGSGKTTLAKFLGHAVHRNSREVHNVPFDVKHLQEEDLHNWQETFDGLPARNMFISFDDMSYANKTIPQRKWVKIKSDLTKIRHKKDKDIKVILCGVIHYGLAADKHTRQSDFTFFSSMGDSEFDNTKRMGLVPFNRLKLFKRHYETSVARGWWTVAIPRGGGAVHKYRFEDPFHLVLYRGPLGTRELVVPTLEWTVPDGCTTCGNALPQQPMSVDELLAAVSKSESPKVVEQALKHVAMEAGHNYFSQHMMAATNRIRTLRDETVFPPWEDVAKHYGWTRRGKPRYA